MFSVTFLGVHGELDTKEIRYTEDLASTQQIQKYITDHLELYPLQFSARESLLKCSNLKKLVITDIIIGQYYMLNLRYFDGESNEWFDSRNLPIPKRPWYVRIKALRWKNKQKLVICSAELFPKIELEISYLDELMYVRKNVNPLTTNILTAIHRGFYPQIWSNE